MRCKGRKEAVRLQIGHRRRGEERRGEMQTGIIKVLDLEGAVIPSYIPYIGSSSTWLRKRSVHRSRASSCRRQFIIVIVSGRDIQNSGRKMGEARDVVDVRSDQLDESARWAARIESKGRRRNRASERGGSGRGERGSPGKPGPQKAGTRKSLDV